MHPYDSAPTPAPTRVYHCESDHHETLLGVKQRLQALCAEHAYRLVKVETMDGDVYEGKIVLCDRSIMFLQLSNEGLSRAFLPGPPNPYFYNNVILPLVLFDLLAITLI
ncbi:hypothetical protein ACTHPH_21080 [Paenibacillus pasadenensis]|uniref:Uncharacterized protein n=1 Tax=Paenibacillus pasadenensis TaxID=217090 RepID=A0A2N5N006_9BACL|nr:hypothetical protein [Paenibacillus pasadenensis]PLT43670.1 hypothetical protein B8V81_2101 [Paenibacillus pasadenensis]